MFTILGSFLARWIDSPYKMTNPSRKHTNPVIAFNNKKMNFMKLWISFQKSLFLSFFPSQTYIKGCETLVPFFKKNLNLHISHCVVLKLRLIREGLEIFKHDVILALAKINNHANPDWIVRDTTSFTQFRNRQDYRNI